MTKFYLTTSKDLETELKNAIGRHICASFDILTTKNGKPYIDGNPIYFSKTHSKDFAAFVLCDKPVGIDLELFSRSKYKSVLSRFTDRERQEICGNRHKFLINWTVKEAFIKMRGGTLLSDLKELEYAGGKLYFHGAEQACEITVKTIENIGICAICEG